MSVSAADPPWSAAYISELQCYAIDYGESTAVKTAVNRRGLTAFIIPHPSSLIPQKILPIHLPKKFILPISRLMRAITV